MNGKRPQLDPSAGIATTGSVDVSQLRSLLRIVDANANRAAEGLRVVEEYLRFALEDGHLAGLTKRLRHDLTTALQEIPARSRHAARDTERDVGTSISTPQESSRTSVAAIAAASFARVAQALRSLEEYLKPISVAVAGRIEQLRYDLYTLERATTITGAARERLAASHLYVLVDARESREALEWLGQRLIEGGADLIQLREKRLADRELIERARLLAKLTRGTSTLLIMNDRPDLAVLCGADGVHVGQEELTVADARAVVGPDALVGVSTHSLDQARQAVLDGADYIGCGPTFPSLTKEFDTFAGTEFLRQVSAEITLPAFAIGGITEQNAAQVVAAGFHRAAVTSAVVDSPDPAERASALRAMFLSK